MIPGKSILTVSATWYCMYSSQKWNLRLLLCIVLLPVLTGFRGKKPSVATNICTPAYNINSLFLPFENYYGPSFDSSCKYRNDNVTHTDSIQVAWSQRETFHRFQWDLTKWCWGNVNFQPDIFQSSGYFFLSLLSMLSKQIWSHQVSESSTWHQGHSIWYQRPHVSRSWFMFFKSDWLIKCSEEVR